MRVVAAIVVCLCAAMTAHADDPPPPPPIPVTDPLDGVTPHAFKPAEPTSTYTLSGFDSVNYYTGGLSFNLPLLKIGGRGDVGYTMSLGIRPPGWNVQVSLSSETPGQFQGQFTRVFSSFAAGGDTAWWHASNPGYGPGFVFVKPTGESPGYCGIGNTPQYIHTFTHLVYVQPGGSETELYDTQGASGNGIRTISGSDCNESRSADRGRNFEDHTGAGLRFESDAEAPLIGDPTDATGGDATVPGTSVFGYLYFRNGGRARVENSRIVSLQDRNGNLVSFCYAPCTESPAGDTSGTQFNVQKITDALGRVYRIQYGISDGLFGTVDRITFRPNRLTSEQVIRVAYGASNGAGNMVGGGVPGGLFLGSWFRGDEP